MSSMIREPIKSSVSNLAAQKRRENAVSVGKERREALLRNKRICRDGVVDLQQDELLDIDNDVDEDRAVLDAQTISAVEELRSAISYTGKGASQKNIEALRNLRRFLSKSSVTPIDAALHAGVVPLLSVCMSFGSPDEQLLEAAWCLTNIASGELEQTKAVLPALPLLVAYIGEKSSVHVAEQCAWALGNVAGEGVEMREILLSCNAMLPLSRMLLSDRGSTATTAAWALSNLIKGPDPKAATELIKIHGLIDALIRHLKKTDEKLVTEVAWVIVYLSALSNIGTSILAKSEIFQLLVRRLATSEQLQLLIPVLRSIGNLVAAESHITDVVLGAGQSITEEMLLGLIKCVKSEHRALKKEGAWVLSNIASGSVYHKQLIFSSEAVSLLMHLLSNASFDIKKEAAYALGNLCVVPLNSSKQPDVIQEHLIALVSGGCLPGFINLVRSPDVEAARLGLQFLELVMRGLPNGEGPKLVEKEDGIDAMERFQFHENENLRNMANRYETGGFETYKSRSEAGVILKTPSQEDETGARCKPCTGIISPMTESPFDKDLT